MIFEKVAQTLLISFSPNTGLLANDVTSNLGRSELIFNGFGANYLYLFRSFDIPYEPRHDKTNKMSVRPAKTQISLAICPIWSESSLSAWRKLGSLATHWAHSENSDQTGRMPRLIWVFAGRTLILLVLSCHGSYLLISKIYTVCAAELVKVYVNESRFGWITCTCIRRSLLVCSGHFKTVFEPLLNNIFACLSHLQCQGVACLGLSNTPSRKQSWCHDSFTTPVLVLFPYSFTLFSVLTF